MAGLHFSNRRWRRGRLLVALLLGLSGIAAAQEPSLGDAPLSLGVAPSHSLVQLEGFYAPLAQYLGEVLGRSVRFGTSSSYDRFTTRLEHGDFDVVLLQSTDLRGGLGYTPLLRFANPPTLLIITRLDAALGSLADIRGKTLAVPPPQFESNAAALRRLRGLSIDPDVEVTVIQVAQHNACLQYVASGRAAACATTENDLRLIGVQEGVDYAVLDRSRGNAPLVFATGVRVTPAQRERLKQALLAWPTEAVRRGVTSNGDWLKLEDAASEVPRPGSSTREGAVPARTAQAEPR